ncbi:MAG: hypothetical protein M3445_10440, partial [Actinomycetota bacterium]|nr:hypothetical protein [Actinomycetota bacterium]
MAVSDAAIRDRSTTRVEIETALRRQHRWSGRPRALAGVPLIDARRETWLESYSFAALHAEGVELPLPQVEVFDAH